MSTQLEEIKATTILRTAEAHIAERAQQYDKAIKGERSIPKVVQMFKALTGVELTAEQGWLFMVCLKLVRTQQGSFKLDSYEDGAAYFALAGEAASEKDKLSYD